MARWFARATKATAHSPAIGHKTLASLSAHGNGKCPTDLRRDAQQAWARFCACTKALPAGEAAPLWRLIAAEATIHIS